MPDASLPPGEAADVNTVLRLADRVRARGRYSENFAEAVRALNAACARIFHEGPDPDARASTSEWA